MPTSRPRSELNRGSVNQNDRGRCLFLRLGVKVGLNELLTEGRAVKKLQRMLPTWATLAMEGLDRAGRRPVTARELVLLALLVFSLIWVTHRREVAYVVTDPGNHHVIT